MTSITTDGGELDSDTVGAFRAAGVVVTGDDALVQNSGTIRSKDASSAAVELNVVEREGFPAAGMSSQLESSGLLSAPDDAVLGGAGQESITNHGRIVGNVSLGEGDDTFVFGNRGRVDGEVALGGADDAIDVSGRFSSYDDVMARARQRGDDLIINLVRNTTIVLKNVNLGALTEDDFIV